MIDTHCHLTFPDLADRVNDVIADARETGVDRMISVGTTPDDARAALRLAQRFDAAFATVGLHPHYVRRIADFESVRNAMRELADEPRVVAFGEMGLDYHYDDPPRDIQQKAFAQQLDFVSEIDAQNGRTLPIIIHNRKATDDVLAMIADSDLFGDRFVFHCFTGDASETRRILDSGAMISFTGIVTFPNARDVAVASDVVPMDRLMIETDSPYLTPAPHRKVRPNEPRYVVEVARFLAERRGMRIDHFTARADANAQRFFALPEASAG